MGSILNCISTAMWMSGSHLEIAVYHDMTKIPGLIANGNGKSFAYMETFGIIDRAASVEIHEIFLLTKLYRKMEFSNSVALNILATFVWVYFKSPASQTSQ